jgi:hypothetical protein
MIARNCTAFRVHQLLRIAMAESTENPRTNWIVFVVASLYLVAQAGWRLFTRAGEWPPAMVRNLEIAIDVGMSIAIVALFFKFKDEPARRVYATLLVILAGAAMIVIFGIRFSSDVGWWTGHRRNWTG